MGRLSFRGAPVIVDPGTGAYYAEKVVRTYLADWAAHNSPQLKSPPLNYPRRFGTFLWGEHHKLPMFRLESPLTVCAEGVDDADDAAALWECGVEAITGPWASTR